ncbi:hypothetical protein SAMN04488535_1602 [Corynebacterium mycetoides]|uniref:Secreted protein n=1 Tax=Corynebacterium mycetoides TaxID=38302 RepID=A0A1G9PU02_9CORY|nr:hypothetical protein SAMN04488535_1602 [Corynebacterium mycetoides]
MRLTLRGRWLRPAAVTTVTAVTAVAAASAFIPVAGAQQSLPVALHPDNPAVAQQWVNPAVRPGEGETATVTLVSAPTVLSAHDPLTVTLMVTNTSDEQLEGLTVTPRRGPATGSVLDQQVAAVANPLEYTVVGREVGVDTQLPPGGSTQLELTITEDALPLPGIATYPVMFVLSAENGALLDTERFHISIRGTPDGARPAGMTTLFPLSAPVDIVPGETGSAPGEPPLILGSENLAGQLAPGGRLRSLLDVYTDATADPQVAESTCLALDPATIHTVNRMTSGYTVSATRPDLVEPPQRLRDSWGINGAENAGEPGRGSEDARAWLDAVTQLAAARCVVALPWANTDLNAVARTGDPWLMREAVERGPSTLQEIVGSGGLLNTVVPGAGYVAPGVPAALGWADHSRSTIAAEGIQGSWERAQRSSATQGSGPAGDASEAALDRADTPPVASVSAPEPEQPVRVLMAGNTVPPAPPDQRFAWMSPGVMSVGYQDSLATVLATVGEHPETTGYSPEGLRFDYTRDSPKARSVNAASAVHLAAQSAWEYPSGEQDADGPGPAPILLNPPVTWDAAGAADVMDAVRDTLSTGAAQPMSLESYLSVPEGTPVAGADATGSPAADPTIFSDSEILTASQQGRFIDELSGLLVADPAIALSRYGFTLPLRRDLLTALSLSGRRAYTFHPEAVEATSRRLAGSRDTLNALRSAVALIPPGNVYTRTSPASPLVIVARNGLPLPVDATIRYHGPEGARLNVPPTLRIPANGSITTSMTADLPEEQGGTQLRLFLASPQGAQISQPVDITVRTSGVALRGWVILAALAIFLALLLVFPAATRRHRRQPPLPPAQPEQE